MSICYKTSSCYVYIVRMLSIYKSYKFVIKISNHSVLIKYMTFGFGVYFVTYLQNPVCPFFPPTPYYDSSVYIMT